MIVRIKTEEKIEERIKTSISFQQLAAKERRTKLRTAQAVGSNGMKTRSSRPSASTRP